MGGEGKVVIDPVFLFLSLHFHSERFPSQYS
jgi:hypothetical protein